MSHEDKYADLPKQLREEAMAADRAVEELTAGKTHEGTPSEDSAPKGEAPAANQNQDASAKSQETPSQASGGDFEQKYKVLRGKYDKEVPELNQKLRALHIENTDLQRRLTDLEKALASRGADNGQPASPASSDSDGVNPGDYEEYGEEFVRLAEENRRLKNAVDEMRGDFETVKQTTAKTAQERFVSDLSTLKPEWQSIDGDPAFDVWLHEKGKKQDYLKAASEKNAQGIVDIMDLYVLRTGKSYGNNNEPQSSPESQRIHTPDIESQVQPSSTGTGDRGSEKVQGRVYTAKEVNQFYDLYAAGTFPFSVGDIQVFNEEDGARLDQDITRANMEGRIVG
jgi:hypothetical protein